MYEFRQFAFSQLAQLMRAALHERCQREAKLLAKIPVCSPRWTIHMQPESNVFRRPLLTSLMFPDARCLLPEEQLLQLSILAVIFDRFCPPTYLNV